jgi:hypothetical protein
VSSNLVHNKSLPWALLSVALLAFVVLLLFPAPGAAQNCTPPQPSDGRVSGAWWAQYAAWCRANGGTTYQNSSGGGCTPGPNWKCGGGSSSAGAATGQDALNQAAYQLGTAIGQGLVNWLFTGSANPQAAAQRRAFLADLEQKRLEAQRQRRVAEAQRIQAMQDRLYAKLKLNGIEDLHLKGMDDAPSGSGLRLKTREEAQQGYGINGLPGIYVGGPKDGVSSSAPSGTATDGNAGTNAQQPAGAAGEQGKGIPGLPGIYVNGPRDERFSLGGEPAPAGPLPSNAVAVGKDGQPDFDKMSPQQIAELRQQVAALPPDQLDKMIDATQPGKPGSAAPTSANGEDAQPLAFKPSPQAQATQQAPASPDHSARPGPSNASGQSVTLAQLQQQAGSQAAGPGASLEEQSVGARSGFDTPVNAGTSAPVIPGPPGASSRNSVADETAVPTLSSGGLHTKPPPEHQPFAAISVAASPSVARAAAPAVPPPPADVRDADVLPVIHPEDLKIPSRDGHAIFTSPQERLAELRRELAVLRQVLVKLGQAQMDSADRKQWEDTMNKASGDAAYQAGNMAVDVFNYFALKRFRAQLESVQKSLEDAAVKVSGETADPNRREQLGAAIRLMEGQKAELGAIVENMEGVTHNGDNFVAGLQTYDWFKKDDHTPEHDLEGLHLSMQMALDNKLVQKWAGVNGEWGDTLKFGTYATDATYDATSVLISAARLRQMNQQSQQYYDRVNELSAQMKNVVGEIKSLEQQIQK